MKLLSYKTPRGTVAGLCGAFLLLTVVTTCNWGYGPPIDRTKFGSAVLHEDGARCVFARHDAVYRPAEGMRAFPDGGIPRYDTDRHQIGIIDLHTGKTTTLVDEKNRRWLDGHGGFHVVGVRGEWGLVRQSGQRPNYEHDHRWFQLDLSSGDLVELELDQELAARGPTLERVELVDADFTLILVSKKGQGAQEIWSRIASGSLRRLATTDHYYGTTEGQIWWYDVAARAGARTDYSTGATVLERRANFAMPRKQPTRICEASFDGKALRYQEKIGYDWRIRELVVQ